MRPEVDQHRVAASFDRSADYADNAGVQRPIAVQLAERIAALPLPAGARILEIGCGTGFLTAELLARGVAGQWLVTDKAPAMVDRCRAALGERAGLSFMPLDGEYGLAEAGRGFDLICSSMAFQWFDDLPQAISRMVTLLAPGGRLVFNTLAAETFAEWRAAHEACGVAHGGLPYPAARDLVEALALRFPVTASVETHVEHHRNAREFLQRLKAIGAGTARNGHRPLPPSALRQVMARFDRQGAQASYEVVTVEITQDGWPNAVPVPGRG